MSRRFVVRWLPEGAQAVVQEQLWAQREDELRALLATRGVVLSIQPEARRWLSREPRSFDDAAFALFCKELQTLVQAGMTVVEAVDTLAGSNELVSQDGQSLARQLLSRLQRGQSLSGALADIAGSPEVLVAAVKAGERTSDLAQSLQDYLRFHDLVQQLRRKVVSAAIYPALVTSLGVGISLFLLLVVLPSFSRMYTQLRSDAQGMTAWMIGLSQWVSEHRVLALTTVVSLGLLLLWWIGSGRALRSLKSWSTRLPWTRSRVKDFQLAMTYQALALMLKGGYPMTEALRVAGGSGLDDALRQAVAQALARIERGESVAQSLNEQGLADEVSRRLMAAAERNGDFHLAADVVSKLHAARFELFVERLTRLVEPLLLMLVALLVGTIVIMMYLPVFDMATRLR